VVACQRVPIVYPRAGTIWKSNAGVTLYFVGSQLPFLKNTGNDINDANELLLLSRLARLKVVREERILTFPKIFHCIAREAVSLVGVA